ncbi:MAG: cytochrome P450 [Anaerolineae bacterium]|nr:cytochrome P450 [Anaerolineae bacterium]
MDESSFPPYPPGLKGHQLLPHLREMQRNPLSFLMRLQESFGDVVFFEAGKRRACWINHPEGIKRVLQDNSGNYTKDTIQYNMLSTITGKGLLTSDGPLWFRQRRLEQPAFSRQRLAALDQIVLPAVDRLLERWQTAAQNSALLDVDSEMMRLTLEVVGKALFSIDLSDSASRLTAATLTVLDDIVHRVRHPIGLPRFFPTPRNLKFHAALSTLDATIYNLIAERRQNHQRSEDMLGILLTARDEETGQPMSEKQIRDEVITLLIAGHETVASALTWGWYLLAENPLVWERMRAEIAQVLNRRPPKTDDLQDLVYTGWVFDETLRLYPPAWLITRKATQTDEILGYRVDPETLIILSPYTIHRHPKFWEEPGRFAPIRFSPGHEAKRPRYAYIPFGGGPRLCIGNNFALTEARLVLARIAQHFRLFLPESAEIKMDALVTLRPHGGLPMRVDSL